MGKMTPEQKADNERSIREMEDFLDCLQQGISPCCHAPLISHAVQNGRHKGHGPRYCSKCKEMVYRV